MLYLIYIIQYFNQWKEIIYIYVYVYEYYMNQSTGEIYVKMHHEYISIYKYICIDLIY
jgi:hypothetical protein